MRNRKIQRAIRDSGLTKEEWYRSQGLKVPASKPRAKTPSTMIGEKPWRNCEGYNDPTAYQAIRNADRELAKAAKMATR